MLHNLSLCVKNKNKKLRKKEAGLKKGKSGLNCSVDIVEPIQAFSYLRKGAENGERNIYPLLTILFVLIFSIRMQGSAALNLCTVASGGADAYYEFGLHVWDFAAAGLIVEEAGGVVIDPSGK